MDAIHRAWLPLAAVALLVVIAGLLPAGEGVRVAEAPQDAAPALVGSEVPVYAFLDALDAGDPSAAAGQIAAGADPLALPGMPFRFASDAPDPRAALAFYAAVIDGDALGCRTAGAVVTCDLRIDSDYARAVRVGGRVVPVDFTVAGGEITAILRGAAGAPALVGYCNWVRRTAPELQLFDAFCMPSTAAGAASGQRRLAAEFVAAGRPVPGYGDFHPLWNRW